MITIGEYFKPKSVAEAYELLTSKKRATLIGGGAWIRMGSRRINRAIDLSNLNLNFIRETEDKIEIGAMTTFGDIDRSELMNSYFNGIVPRSFQEIVGVQLRNIVTVGGTVYSRFGFSDFNTALMALDCSVVLHAKGEMPLADFLTDKSKEKDIVEQINIKKEKRSASYQMMRNSLGDYPILNVAASQKEGMVKIAVGARPQRAMYAPKAMEYISSTAVNAESAEEAGKIATEELPFGTNSLGSAEYRRELCKMLVKRAILEVAAK